MRLSDFLWRAWCGQRVDDARLRRMESGDEPIPSSWAAAIERSTGGEVRSLDWRSVTPDPPDAEEVPDFPSVQESDRLRLFDRLVDRRRRKTQQIGRHSRRNHLHPVYRWLDDIGQNLTWLADQVGSSRPSLQNYIIGFRRQTGGAIRMAPAPPEIVQAVKRLSAGRVTAADWKTNAGAATEKKVSG